MAISMLTVVGVLSFAQDSYATGIFYVGTGNGDLYIIDIPAGTSNLIGNMGVQMTDVAIDPTTGNLWGISFTQLYSIDKTNANIVLIGTTLGTGDSNALAFSDGGTAYEAGNSSTDLRTVNLATGATSPVGNMGFASSGDLIWDTSLNMLWLSSSSQSDSLVLVDPTTGAGTQIGPFNFSSVFGLGFDSGILYGTTTGGQLISINTTTGAGTLVIGIVNNIFGATDNRFTEIEKTLDEGPEEIGIYLPGPTAYQYTIVYEGPSALIKDTVPAEFEVLSLTTTDGTADFFKPGKGPKSQSSTKIEWNVPGGISTLTVDIQTVKSPGHGKKTPDVFKPTSCGPLPINDGATAFEVDEDGNLVLVEVEPGVFEPVVIVGPSNSLEVEAVDGAKPCIEVEEPNS